MQEKLIRIKAVIDVTGKSRSSIYADIAKGSFPKPVAIGARAVAWPQSEVSAWVAQQIAAR
jgi:prophage regulatory protein